MTTAQQERVIRYYKATHKAFTRVWAGPRDQALHFGYYDSPGVSHPEALLRMNAVLADLARVSDGETVLDAGCGLGGSTVWLAKHRGCTTIGVNIAPHQLTIAENHAAKSGVAQRVSYLLADYANTALPDRSIDLYWAVEATVHAQDRRAVFAEAFRLLRPGGRVLLVEYFLAKDAPDCGESITGYQQLLDGWAMPPLWSITDYTAALESTGFVSTRTEDLTDKIAPSLRRMRRMVVAVLPLTRLLERMRVYDPDRVAHNVASLRIADALLKGTLRYAVVLAEKPGEDCRKRGSADGTTPEHPQIR